MFTNMLVAVLITSNLVAHPCTGGVAGQKCQYCSYDEGNEFWNGSVRIPEHFQRIGYDLDWVVQTNYLPVIEKPAGIE